VLWVAYGTIAADSSNGVTNTIPDAVDTVVCAPDDGWKYHPKHVEQFPDINKLFNFASCWIYEYVGILLGVHYILHISRIRVKESQTKLQSVCFVTQTVHNFPFNTSTNKCT